MTLFPTLLELNFKAGKSGCKRQLTGGRSFIAEDIWIYIFFYYYYFISEFQLEGWAMSSGFQRPSLHQIAFCCLFIVCFLVVFFVYYTPEYNFHTFLCATEAEASKSNRSPHNETQGISVEAADAEPETILLIWMWPFGNKYELSCNALNIRCHLTDDKSLYHKADGVLFHHRDLNLASMPKEPRPWFQKWVWFNMESPANSHPFAELNHSFNLTSNYRLDSHIPVPYGRLEYVSGNDTFQLPAKDKVVCWIVSNWNSRYKRVQYYNELKKHININGYGAAFNRRINNEERMKIISECKFYLAFENSIYKDYMTEKLFYSMQLGSLPIALGPSRQNYEDHIPSDSFIHVDDFSSPKELADWLLYLDKNNTEYMKYFNWRSRYEVKMSMFGAEHACRACSYIQQNRQYQVFHELNKWYWG
uniref:Fucosyltransferase n=2 Tax=Echeneis naucrates TaxID=173247 RepID=A0A665WG41_ECHNA